jgi:hypothetical protein
VGRPAVERRRPASILYGAIEEILTGWVFGQLPDGDDDVAAAERAVTAVVTAGLAPTLVPARA